MTSPLFKKFFPVMLLAAAVSTAGCSSLLDFPRTIWGSSTRDLERARENSIQKTYHCQVTECFDAVLALTVRPKELESLTPEEKLALETQRAETPAAYRPTPGPRPADDPALPITPLSTTYLDLFLKKPKQNMMIVMGVPNCVNTTEVGIFFTPIDGGNVKVELSSLSSKAKRNAGELIFAELGKKFPEIQ